MWHREVGCGVGMWGVEERRVEEARALQEKMEREKKALQASAEKVGCGVVNGVWRRYVGCGGEKGGGGQGAPGEDGAGEESTPGKFRKKVTNLNKSSKSSQPREKRVSIGKWGVA